MTTLNDTRRAGVFFALSAYASWGFFPLYFRHLQPFTALEIVLHRSVWAVPFLLLVVAGRGQLRTLLRAVRAPRTLAIMMTSAAILAGNWLLFAWAVQAKQVLQISLGYYINPLVTVLLAVTVLGERLTRLQVVAILLAVGGVAVLALRGEAFPWLALGVAVSFAVYGLLRKTMLLGAADGLLMETLLMLPFSLGGLIWLALSGQGHFGTAGGGADLLIMTTGVVTTVPLIFFAAAARRLALSSAGMFQYLTPTLQFLTAVFLFGETFTPAHAVTFTLIWIAVGLFLFATWRKSRRKSRGERPAAQGTEPPL